MAEDNGNNDGGGGTGTGTEDEAASRLLASWMNDGGSGGSSDNGGGGDNSGGGQAQDVKSLPDWAQKLITDTRSEAAQHRTGKNEAEQRYQATLDGIAKALGLKQDEVDPEKLTQQLSQEQGATREAKMQLAVYRRAAANGANPDALLDSASFLRSLGDVDASKDDAVDAAIKAAVQKNSGLAAQRPRGFEHGPRADAPAGNMNDLILGQLRR